MYYWADLVNAFLFHTWWEPFVPLYSVAFFCVLGYENSAIKAILDNYKQCFVKKGLTTFHGQTTIPPVKFFTGLNSFRGKSKSV